MKTSERLLNASKTIWDAYNEHPFVLGIQNGTLERNKFRYYIMQDFLYLKDYAKTYAVGVAKAKSVETANLFAKYINVMNGELDVHKGYMGKFAVTQEESDAMKPSLDNLSYTSYMVRVAYDESEVEVLAAVLPLLAAKMAPGGVVLCETEREADLPEQAGSLTLVKQYNYGKIKVSRYERGEEV